MLVLVKCFSCTPDANSSEVFLSATHLMLVLVMSFSYNPDDTFNKVFVLVTLLSDASFSKDFLLHF